MANRSDRVRSASRAVVRRLRRTSSRHALVALLAVSACLIAGVAFAFASPLGGHSARSRPVAGERHALPSGHASCRTDGARHACTALERTRSTKTRSHRPNTKKCRKHARHRCKKQKSKQKKKISEEKSSAPVDQSAPAIDGEEGRDPEVGMTLTATTGAWSGGPSSYRYQWQDCNSSGEGCGNLAGATGSSYQLNESDVGHDVRVVVTAANTGGSSSAPSAAKPKVRTARWYSPKSAWNTPIPANPQIAANSASLVAQWAETSTCETEPGSYCMSTLTEWIPTVWYAPAGTPSVEVQIDAPSCDAHSVRVPIPADAVPDSSSEGHMMIRAADGSEYDFIQVQSPGKPPKSHYAGDHGGCPTVNAWTAGLVTTGGNWETGMGSGEGVRGSGTPEGTGLITQQDLEMPAGSTWPHALAVSYGPTCRRDLSWCGAVYPAISNAGSCENESRCLPEGARLQLEPSINCSTWPSIKYEWQRQWCRTWQTYGVIISDTKGTGLVGGAVQYSQNPLSWSNGFKPPWDSDTEAPANPAGERPGVMPRDLLSHFRVLAW